MAEKLTDLGRHTHDGINTSQTSWRDVFANKIIITNSVHGTAAANSNSYGIIFIAPFTCRVESFREVHGTAATAGTLDLVKMSSGSAVVDGVSILPSTIDLTATANTPQERSFGTASISNKNLRKNQMLALKSSGALTNLQDVTTVTEIIVT